MGIFSNFFNRKSYIDTQIEKINVLRVTMRQNEAVTETRVLINELMKNPSLVNGVTDTGSFANFLTNQFNNFQSTQEIQFVTELAFFEATKTLKKKIHPFNLFDRLIIMYNAEDFLIDTVKEANDLQYNPLSAINRGHHNQWKAEEMLLKMRYHDLFHENQFFTDGSNDNSFNGQEFITISKMINDREFGSLTKNDIVEEGAELINKCYDLISSKYSFKK